MGAGDGERVSRTALIEAVSTASESTPKLADANASNAGSERSAVTDDKNTLRSAFESSLAPPCTASTEESGADTSKETSQMYDWEMRRRWPWTIAEAVPPATAAKRRRVAFE